MHSEDTHPEAEVVRVEILRSLSPARRIMIAGRMSRDVRAISLAGLRRQFPDSSEGELLDAYVRRTLPPALAEAVIQERARRESNR